MISRCILVVIICLFAWGPSLAQQKHAPVPIRVVRFHPQPIVEGTLNGKKAYFLVDTGATISLLDLSVKKKYRFQASYESSNCAIARGIGGAASMTKVYRVDMSLGTLPIETKFYGMDLAHISAHIMQDTGIEIAGVIGTDLMKRYGFNLDFFQKQMTISRL
ncbi:retropepsin-like aspartic protease [Pontibacter sp. G13]|uniref:retropepsin-like aspartic protease n=1 Tax=Pontibacter sp. G13 TaxID=3074898 RepID=UPI00288916CB|nr:retropepsin-like aspartic protease [Pontibacter sp. G13]WNJ20183.1 retropepsin-like aspartic protease [Pontibacter sp. G13]